MSKAEPEIDWPEARLFRWVEEVFGRVYQGGVIIAAILAIAIVALGFWECGWGVYLGLSEMVHLRHTVESRAEVVTFIIRGIELELLAPLLYLVVIKLATYVLRVRSASAAVEAEAKARLVGVKALAVGLLVTMIATDLTGKILGQKPLGISDAAAYAIVVAVLGAYGFGLEHLPGRTSSEVRQDRRDPKVMRVESESNPPSHI